MFPSSTVVVSTTDSTECAGTFAFQVIEDAVISACLGTLSGYSGVTFTFPTIIYCHLTSITLASGKVALYKH